MNVVRQRPNTSKLSDAANVTRQYRNTMLKGEV